MMEEGIIYNYQSPNGKRGLDAMYLLRGDTLFIKILGSNIWSDYTDALFKAWPRVKPFASKPWKFHRVWWEECKKFREHLKTVVPWLEIMEYRIIGHSAGGSQAIYMNFLLPPRRIVTTAINAPNCMNRPARDYIAESGLVESLYDGGDLIHLWPFGYAKNPGLRQYARTPGLADAHNNMPDEWERFPV